jgi:hypothetical protein
LDAQLSPISFEGSNALPQEEFTILDNLSDRWNDVKSFCIWNCWVGFFFC